MTYNLKKDYLKNWDLQKINEKSILNIEQDDDQDIYISERSSVTSSNDMNQTPSPIIKRLLTPIQPPPQKQPHTLLYPYNELPENGIPAATQLQLDRKEEKKQKKNIRKAPPGQGDLVPFPETKPPEMSDNYYPYWYYYKAKNPDWIMRHRQTADGQLISHESVDPSQYASPPALITSPIKPRQQPRKSRQNGIPITQPNQDKQRHDHIEKNSPLSSSRLTPYENDHHQHQQKTVSKQFIPLKDADNDERRDQPSRRTITQQQRRKLKTENDWADHYAQSLSNKSPQDSNSLTITSSTLINRPRNRSKISDKHSSNSDIDENGKHRHHHHNHHHHHEHNHAQNPPTIPTQQNHHHHHHNHHHIRRRPPSGAEFQVVDISFKKPERTTYFQQTRDQFHSPPPAIYNQSSYLPPITRDYHYKTTTNRFPTEYYGTLARQAQDKDWNESVEIPKIYKPDLQTRFYDRYLNNVIDKRLVA